MAGALALTAGCTVGPRHVDPVAPLPAQGQFLGASETGIAAAPVPGDWWRLFDDPALDAHVQRALAANADIRVALGNLEVARAAVRGAKPLRSSPPPCSRAARAPARRRGSQAPARCRNRATTSPRPLAMKSISSDDCVRLPMPPVPIFRPGRGRARHGARRRRRRYGRSLCRGVRGGRGQAGGRGPDRSAAKELRPDCSPARCRRGLSLRTRAIEDPARGARAALPAFEADRMRALFQLAALEGCRRQKRHSLRCPARPRRSRAVLPVGDGNALLARRPDIREAERKLAAATARIGVATADLYPRFQLGGSAGLLSGNFTGFPTPLISWAFPNQGAARAGSRRPRAPRLPPWPAGTSRCCALREVETALADYQAEQRRNAELRSALADAEKVVDARGGTVSPGCRQLSPGRRRRAWTRNDTGALLAASDLRIALIQVALFRALGGGWDSPSGTMPISGRARRRGADDVAKRHDDF